MIDFRYHLVSIIAVFFALAAGIVLGAGPFDEAADQALTSQVSDLRDRNQDLQDQVNELQRNNDFREGFIGTVEPALTTDALTNRRIVLVTLPGSDAEVVAAVRDSLTTAGAGLTGTVAINDTWTDPDQEQVLDELAVELVTEGTTLPEGSGYDRGAALLAGALVDQVATIPPETPSDATETPAPDTTADPATAGVLAALAEAGLVSVDGDVDGMATLAVVVAGPPLPGDDTSDSVERGNRLVPIPTALDAAGRGAVVSGVEASAADGGVVALVRGSGDAAEQVSTVDVANQAAGRIATVFALVEQESDGSGHYGVVGATDGPLPPDFAAEPDSGE